MFLPGNQAEKAKEAEQRKAAFKSIEAWSLDLIPEDIRGEADVSVQEIQCGDPACSPVDTAITVTFKSGCNGLFGVPAEAKDVTKEELKSSFPTEEVLRKWQQGEEAEWPPYNEADQMLPQLRFDVGTRVECRIGQNSKFDWAPGTVVQLWYREPNWPQGSFAPYKIQLDDGRQIFAPADMDQVIRAAT